LAALRDEFRVGAIANCAARSTIGGAGWVVGADSGEEGSGVVVLAAVFFATAEKASAGSAATPANASSKASELEAKR
jgi:hypothetical protein